MAKERRGPLLIRHPNKLVLYSKPQLRAVRSKRPRRSNNRISSLKTGLRLRRPAIRRRLVLLSHWPGRAMRRTVRKLSSKLYVQATRRALQRPFYTGYRRFNNARLFRAWDLRKQFLTNKLLVREQAWGISDENRGFVKSVLLQNRRLRAFTKFFNLRLSVMSGKRLIRGFHRVIKASFRLSSLYSTTCLGVAMSKKLTVLYNKALYRLTRLGKNSVLAGPALSDVRYFTASRLAVHIFVSALSYKSSLHFCGLNNRLRSLLKFDYFFGSPNTVPSELFTSSHFARDLAMAENEFSSASREDDWNYFWNKLIGFKWFFEYKRWRRCFQLASWFRRFRSFRKIKKERFYLNLFRLFFYYLGNASESNIFSLWSRFKRFDERYGSTVGGSGNRFLQSMQMRIGNLLVFLGLSTSSFAALEASKAGLVRINGYTKLNPYSAPMIGDMLQFNIEAAYSYLALFSDLYWVRVELQTNFVGFLQVLFSILLFSVIRWPRLYEISETDSRLNSRLLLQVLRLFPLGPGKYVPVERFKRKYSLHQNIIKVFPHKYRQSRHIESRFAILNGQETA